MGGILGKFDFLTAHRTALVDHQHHRQRRLFAFLFEVAADGQDFLNLSSVVTAQTKGLVTTEHDQPATQVLDVDPDQIHLPHCHRRRGHVGKDQAFIALHFGQIAGDAFRGTNVNIDGLFIQCPTQRVRFVGIAVDQQHARFAAGVHDRLGFVVVQQRVVAVSQSRGEGFLSLTQQRLLKTKAVFTLFDLHRRCFDVANLNVTAI